MLAGLRNNELHLHSLMNRASLPGLSRTDYMLGGTRDADCIQITLSPPLNLSIRLYPTGVDSQCVDEYLLRGLLHI